MTSRATDADLAAMFDAGSVPSDIAHRYHLSVSHVRARLRAMGKELDHRTAGQFQVHPMWNAEDDDRRRMITEKAAKAARATRLRGAV